MSDSRSETKARGSKRGKIILLLIVIALIVLVTMHVLRKKKPVHQEAPQLVSVAAATPGSMPETLRELGTVTPTATVTVLPQLSGYLTSVGYREGQEVKKGQFLAQIDPRQYEIDKQQSQATLAKDQAVLAQARADLSRYDQLNQRQSIAAQTFADQRFLVQQDEAAVKADRAAIAQYDLDLTYCRITAPISGRVGLRLVDPGNYVTASSDPGIVVITSVKPTTVEFTVPQEAIANVAQRLRTAGELTVTAYNSDNTRAIATGALYAISNQITTATGTVTLRATFANNDEALFPNEFVNVELLVDTLQNVIIVPTAAVQNGAPGDYVYLVGKNDTVSVHKVILGPNDGPRTVIKSGLQANDVVVTDGTDRLSDGVHIKIAPASHAGAASAASAAPAAPTASSHSSVTS